MAFLLGGVLLLLVLAYFVGTSQWALKSIILPRASKSMGAQITVDSASLSPFSSVTLRDLKVQTTGSEPLFAAKSVKARYSLMDIIQGRINISEVNVESPVINLVTFPDGTSNLDPFTKPAKDAKSKGESKEPKKPGQPPQIYLQHLMLTDLNVRKIDQRADGTRQLLAVAFPNLTVTSLGNDRSGGINFSMVARLDQGLASPSNGVVAARVAGQFAFALDAALQPKSVLGTTTGEVVQAFGIFQQAAGAGLVLNADLTPTQLNDVSVRLLQNGKSLGALTVSGPFDATKMEGKLALALTGLDRQALSIAGAALGLDFNQTKINSTNTIELTQRGRTIAVNGAVVVGNFSVTQQGQTTPALDLRTSYAVTYDQTNKTALVQAFALNGTQGGAEFLRGTLAKPMLLELGKASGAVDESALDLVLTNFNLADWRAFLGTNANLTSGRVGANLKVLSRQAGKELLVAGGLSVDELTGAFQANRFDRFAAALDLDVALRGPAVEIKKLAGTLRQSGQPGGAFQVAGNYHLTNKTGLITATLTDLNQNVLKSFLAAALGDKKLESVTINSTTTAKLDSATDMAVKTELHIANLVVNDPSGQVPHTALGLDLNADVAMVKQVAELRNVTLALAKTERAPNSLTVAGRIDMAKSNAWTGNVKITSDGLDVTPYYDLFAGNKPKPATDKPATAPQIPRETKPESEPPAMTLPVSQFTADLSIAKFFLREIAISNWVTKATIDNGKVSVNPFSLTLNGAPVSLTALANVGVPGYQYDVNARLDRVPLEPIVNTFAPDKRGQVKGDLNTGAQIKGAGLTGASLHKNLGGSVLLSLTNANVQVSASPKWQALLKPLALVLRVPELANSPLNWIDARVGISAGTVTLTNAVVESSLFRGGTAGTLTLAPVLTNSTFNNLPVNLELRRSVAGWAKNLPGAARSADFVTLPYFYSVGGTLGKPNPHIDSGAIAKLVLGEALQSIGGDAGKILRGVTGLGGTSTTTNAPSTNASPNLIQGVGGLLQKPARTNAPAGTAPPKKKSGGLNLNDLIK